MKDKTAPAAPETAIPAPAAKWRVRILKTPVAVGKCTAARGAVLTIPQATAEALIADAKAERVY